MRKTARMAKEAVDLGTETLSGVGWVFFGGAALGIVLVAALVVALYLFTKVTPAKWLDSASEEPPVEVDEEEEALARHTFYPVCKRSRVAYLVLCFEEVLKASGQDLERWKWVRRELWSVTLRPDEEWAQRICDLMPLEVLSVSTYPEMVDRRRGTELPDYTFSEVEWNHFRGLYEPLDENILEQVIYVMAQAVDMVLCDCGDTERPYTPDGLHYIDETQEYLKAHGIPLPHDETVLVSLMKHHHPHSGKPFEPPVKLM